MSAHSQTNDSQPIAIVGSGELTSHIRINPSMSGSYRFNIFRLNHDSGVPSNWLEASDVRAIVKLCQVLAFTIADDGWLPGETRDDLNALANELDELTRRWSEI